MKRALVGITGLAALALVAVPPSAGADTVTLNNSNSITFLSTASSVSPGDLYPSSVTGPAGTVNDVNVNIQQSHSFTDDLDVALVSPNGTAVTVQADACGTDPGIQTLKFDDAASLFLSNLGPCDETLTYDPSNYDGPDIFSAPGPAATVGNLAAFNGGPSGGTWSLFGMDDLTTNGGSILGWTMTLDFTPTPPVVPTPPVIPATPVTPTCPKGKKLKNGKCVKKKKKKKRK